MDYRIWIKGPVCPHCNTAMRKQESFQFRCPICHSLFAIDDVKMETTTELLGSEEVFCKETYRGPGVEEE